MIEACRQSAIKDGLMNNTYTLPSVLVLSTTARDSDQLSRSVATIRKQTVNGAIAVSCHWGSPQILVDVASSTGGPSGSRQLCSARSHELAGAATQLLQTAGLAQSDGRPNQNVSHHGCDPADFMCQSPMIQVSLPANFGVELMLLAGAALRPLADRRVLFVGLCGGIDSALKDLFRTSNLETLKRFANQLPKHRIADLYPLFFLTGASSGVARGVLDRLIFDSTIRTREESTLPNRRQDHARLPHTLGTPIPLSANPMM